MKAVDLTQGRIEIFNKNYFEPLKGYQIVWSLYKDGVCVEANKPLMGAKNILGPRERQQYVLNYDYASLDPKSEYFVKVQFLQGKDMPWAKKGYVQMEEQLRVKGVSERPATLMAQTKAVGTITAKAEGADHYTLSGKNFSATFDNTTGAIYSLTYNGQNIIEAGNGPKLDAFRAPTDNDAGIGFHNAWFKEGLYDLQHRVIGKPSVSKKADGSYQISYLVESQGEYGCQQVYSDRDRDPESAYTFEKGKRKLGADDFKFATNQIYTIYPDGSIELQSAISANRNNIVLPRIGYVMKMPKTFNQFQYYGRGPVNNYADRKTGQFIELYKGEVGKQDIMLPKPQSMGNREEVRWCALTNASGLGAAFITDSVMSVSALPWSQQQLTMAAHPHQLPASDGTYLHLDAKVTGLGGASCGQGGPFAEDQATSANYNFGFAIRPVEAGNAQAEAKATLSGEQPISIEHDRTGKVTLSTPSKGRTIMYALNDAKKGTVYSQPINLRAGGKITTWYKDNPAAKTSMSYAKIESVPLQVVFASSQEPGGGNASNLVDGDPSTIWHTMYSITLAKYPHWIDFDAGETKLMKGFTLLPRQSGTNGWVKDYEIFVSQDGKNWGEPICKGTFEASAALKKVMFSKPVKARYIRFRALNEQNGQDFASGAEFTLIAE